MAFCTANTAVTLIFDWLYLMVYAAQLPVIVRSESSQIWYLSTVTSNIQVQLNGYAPKANPTFNGTAIIPHANWTAITHSVWDHSSSWSSPSLWMIEAAGPHQMSGIIAAACSCKILGIIEAADNQVKCKIIEAAGPHLMSRIKKAAGLDLDVWNHRRSWSSPDVWEHKKHWDA